jgi:hypothetical protein
MEVLIDRSFVTPDHMIQEHRKVICIDSKGHEGYILMPAHLLEKAGVDYIKNHATLTYSDFCEEWVVKISFNDFYNDPKRNPDKTISVEFIGIQEGSGREIYRDANGKHYLRENHFPKENFAKWYICSTRLPFGDDGDEPRPNLVFCHNGQQERVRYDDWNGVAAYSDTFNLEFRKI